MGCSSSKADPPGDGHPQYAPMWVVRVEHVLEMEEKLQPHQILKDQNLLEIWRSEMFTLFVSHEWLSCQHPDPNGEQLKVLRLTLQNLIARRLTITRDTVSEFFGGKLSAQQLAGVRGWHMWLDYFCVPQLLAGYPTDALSEDQLLYVNSIPSYVDLCDAFVALVPKAIHFDTGMACDKHSWLQRGWCRTEMWCYFLSTKSKLPIIEVSSPDAVKFNMPLWYRHPVHRGDFGIEMDRVSCRNVIQRALSKYVGELREINKTAYRLHLSLYEELTGLVPKQRSVEEFVSEFEFNKPLQQYKGLGPVACAALSGDQQLLRRVAANKALIHTHAPAMLETLNISDFTPLHLAVWFKSHNPHIVETLLELRADPKSSTRKNFPPLGSCRTVEAVDLLVCKGAGVNFQGKFFSQVCPIHVGAALGAPVEVMARLLELRADVLGGRGGLAGASPLHLIAYSGDSKYDLRNAQLLVEHRADINQAFKMEGVMRVVEVLCKAYSHCRSRTSHSVRVFSHGGSTPLGLCALYDNHGLLAFLLRAQANPEIRDSTGLRPIDLARSETIRAIFQDLTPHIYLLEHTSD